MATRKEADLALTEAELRVLEEVGAKALESRHYDDVGRPDLRAALVRALGKIRKVLPSVMPAAESGRR